MSSETRNDSGSPSGLEPPFRPLPAHLQSLIDLLPLDQPVHRKVLEAHYPKSNYARRLRKIVAEYGWDIERYRGKNGANDDWYVRRSEGPVRPQNIRYEVSPKRREIIYKRDDWKCRMCGASVQEAQNETRPQCDHKIPANRGGASELPNLQTLCTQCNLKKRQACGLCTLPTCEKCPYAFPERFAQTHVVPLPEASAYKLIRIAEREGIPPAIIIQRLIDEAEI